MMKTPIACCSVAFSIEASRRRRAFDYYTTGPVPVGPRRFARTAGTRRAELSGRCGQGMPRTFSADRGGLLYSEPGVGCVGCNPFSANLQGDSVKISKAYLTDVALASTGPGDGPDGRVNWPVAVTKQTGVPAGSPRS
jgi:hypothetical protein